MGLETQAVAQDRRRVERAVRELRQGLPVILQQDGKSYAILAAEAADVGGSGEFAAIAGRDVAILLTAARAHDLGLKTEGEQPVALRAPTAPWTPAMLESLANPAARQTVGMADLRQASVPDAAGAALQLLKLGRLLPACLIATARRGGDFLRVTAPSVLSYAGAEADRLARVAMAAVPLKDAPDARLVAFRPGNGGVEHLALLIGMPETAAAPLVRIHSECFTGDVLGSLRCDCGPQLHEAMARMRAEGAGIILYMAQEGRGIGLVNKLRAYALQDRGLDTLDANRALGFRADERDFAAAASMLTDLGVKRIRLLTNNPEKLAGLHADGIEIVARESLAIAANGTNDDYLATKAARFGHMFD